MAIPKQIIERKSGSTVPFKIDIGNQLENDNCCSDNDIDVSSISSMQMRVYTDEDRTILAETITSTLEDRDVHDYFAPTDVVWVGERYINLVIIYKDSTEQVVEVDIIWKQIA